MFRLDPMQTFDGYPYIVTRVTQGGLCSVTLLPAESPPEELRRVARRMARSNRLDTYLVRGPKDVLLFRRDGTPRAPNRLPRITVAVTGRLLPPLPTVPGSELRARHAALERFADGLKRGGFIVGDGYECTGGRHPSRADRRLLRSRRADGTPGGLERCTTCDGYRGEFLRSGRDWQSGRWAHVVPIYCACANINRCARCHAQLAASRLSAWTYDPLDQQAWYRAAYSGLGHECPQAEAWEWPNNDPTWKRRGSQR